MEIGLKIWSINHEAFKKLFEWYEDQRIDYVELYTYPKSFDKNALSQLSTIPLILHAPTFLHGMNLSEPFPKNAKLIEDITRYRNLLKTERIIFHPGVAVGPVEECIENVINNIRKLKNDFDIILENVPAIGIDNKSVMMLPDPASFRMVITETQVKACLDFGHSITSANYVNRDPFEYINAFMENTPYMFHLSDGDFNSYIDSHISFFKGTFPLEELVRMIPKNSRLSLETPKSDFKQLSEDESNLEIIKRLINDKRLLT